LKWRLSSIFESAINHGYITSNPAPRADLPPEEVKEPAKVPTGDQLTLLIDNLREPYSTMVYLSPDRSGTSISASGRFSRSRGGSACRTSPGVSLRHWGATQMIAAQVDIKAAQQRLGRSRPTTLLIHYAQVLGESADKAAGLLSG
jgi:hypothetical protein